MLPDLVLAGVQRSGTTALFEALYRLPMVERPRRGKGSHYFSYNYHRDGNGFSPSSPTRQWASLVESRQGHPLFCFDACPYYLFHPFAVERMAQALPDVKVMVMLRDPVRAGRITLPPFGGSRARDLDLRSGPGGRSDPSRR